MIGQEQLILIVKTRGMPIDLQTWHTSVFRSENYIVPRMM